MKLNFLAKCKYLPFLGWLVVCLAACSSISQPRLIASYPAKDDTQNQPAPREQFVYDAIMEMEVWDPEAAARRAEECTYDLGGYLVSSQFWMQDGQRHMQLVLAVPAPNYVALHSAILDLGRLTNEHVFEQWVSSRNDSDWTVYSQITVTFRLGDAVQQAISGSGWNPICTLERAWRVFVTIFCFLGNILIWVVVLVGSFILMGVGLWAILRKIWHTQ